MSLGMMETLPDDALPPQPPSSSSRPQPHGILSWLARTKNLRARSRPMRPQILSGSKPFKLAYAAILLGALMNILDAASMGLLVFPADGDMYHGLQAQSIAMFLASTVLNELVFVLGGTNFVQAQGEMLVEILPFMQNIANKLSAVINDDRDALLATTVTTYVLSSLILGVLLLALGFFQIDRWIAYFPQAVLDGALGAIGLSLFISGFEVAQRSSFEWSASYFHDLFTSNSMPVCVSAIVLTILLCTGVRVKKKSAMARPRWGASFFRRVEWEVRQICSNSFFTPGFVLLSGGAFWIAALASKRTMADLVEHHWLFMEVPPGATVGTRMRFFEFWQLFNFHLVRWGAIKQVAVEMVVLIVIGALNLPIYYPTLRDNLPNVPRSASIKKEFIGHGIANIITGLCGTLPCLVVMSNTLFFSRAGGQRIESACVMVLTFLFFIFSKLLLPYIPVLCAALMVFFFGIELMAEALVPTWTKKSLLEYFVILGTMATCTALGFAQGVGIGLAATLAVLGFEHLADYEIRTCFVPLAMLADAQGLSPKIVARLKQESMEQQQQQLDVGVISLAGTAGYTTATKLKQAIHAVQQRGCAALVIDLTYTVRIDRVAASAIFDERSNPQPGTKHPPGFLLGVPLGSPRYDILAQVGSVCADPSTMDTVAAHDQMMHALWPMAEFTDVLGWLSSRAAVSDPGLPLWARNSSLSSLEHPHQPNPHHHDHFCYPESLMPAHSPSNEIPMETPMSLSSCGPSIVPTIDPTLPIEAQWSACWDQLCCNLSTDDDNAWLSKSYVQDHQNLSDASDSLEKQKNSIDTPFLAPKRRGENLAYSGSSSPRWRNSFVSVLERYGHIRFHEPHTLLASAGDPMPDVRIIVVGALVSRRQLAAASHAEHADASSPASKVDRTPADWIQARPRLRLRRRSADPTLHTSVRTIVEHLGQGDIYGLAEFMFGETWSADVTTAGQLFSSYVTIDFSAHDVRANAELALALNAYYSHHQFRMHRLQELYNRALSQGERYKW